MELKRLANYAPPGPGRQWANLRVIEGEEVKVSNPSFREGDYGTYVVFDAHLSNGVTITVSTGARAVVAALQRAVEAGETVLLARFVRKGRGWYVE